MTLSSSDPAVESRVTQPLHIASMLGLRQFVHYLIAQGADKNYAVGQNSFHPYVRPICMAALWGQFETVEELVKSGADLSCDKADYPLLHQAVRSGNLKLVRFLVAQGVPTNVECVLEKCTDTERNPYGHFVNAWAECRLPIDVAKRWGHQSIVDFLTDPIAAAEETEAPLRVMPVTAKPKQPTAAPTVKLAPAPKPATAARTTEPTDARSSGAASKVAAAAAGSAADLASLTHATFHVKYADRSSDLRQLCSAPLRGCAAADRGYRL